MISKQRINIINVSPKYSAIWKCGYNIFLELQKLGSLNINFIDLHSQLPQNFIHRYEKILLKKYNICSSKNDINVYMSPLASSNIDKITAKKNIVLIHDFWPINRGTICSKNVFKYLYRKLPKFDLILSNSQATENEYRSIYPSNTKIKTIHLGLSPIYHNTKLNIMKQNDKFIKFISIGRDEPRKNIRFLLDFLRQYKIDSNIFQLIRVGSFSKKNKKLIKEYNLSENIKCYKNITEEKLIELYLCSNYLLYPSLHEGFGFPVIEAAACGCIPLTSKSGSLPEIIPDNELCLELNTNDWIKKIQFFEFHKNEKLKIRNKCIIHSKKFTWHKYSKDFIRYIL